MAPLFACALHFARTSSVHPARRKRAIGSQRSTRPLRLLQPRLAVRALRPHVPPRLPQRPPRALPSAVLHTLRGDAAGGGINAMQARDESIVRMQHHPEAETGSSSRSGPRISSAAGHLSRTRETRLEVRTLRVAASGIVGKSRQGPDNPSDGTGARRSRRQWLDSEPRWPGGRLQPQDSWSDISAGVDEPQPAFSPSARWSGGIGGHAHAQGSRALRRWLLRRHLVIQPMRQYADL